MAWVTEFATPCNAKAWFSELDKCLSESQERLSSRWATLATVRGPAHGEMAGRPANRTINVRHATIEGLKFVSDTRSGKARDVGEGVCGHAELCWFFPERSTQFRISGLLRVDCAPDSVERKQYWADLEPKQREWWAYPAPGSARGLDVTHMADADVTGGEMPAHFCVCTLLPDFVEVFDQRASPMRRVQYALRDDGTWVSVLVHA